MSAEPTKGRSRRRKTFRRKAKAADPAATLPRRGPAPNPPWFVPVMLGLMIIGLVWVVVYYLTAAQYPVSAWGNWNLVAGFAFIIVGFLMTTRWR